MSKQIDERVVEMRFDNAQFEKNVHTSMSTIDKLKQKLKFKGASEGFENLSKSAKRVDLNTLGNSAEKVGLKFNAMYTMADQALRNITNSAITAGKNIVKALTIDPVKTGFSEYELKMGSIQTIMASTGESLETVNKYLNELNEYSDKTIYSFSDMTQNIGKFTNAGVKLEDAVMAIKGISNEAALSGANANEASRAMYNFAQALSAGYVKLIDWKSIENANMATVGFKNELIKAAVAAGTLTEAGDGMYKTLSGETLNATKNFNESLQEQWMTTEVLVGTLKSYADETTEIGKKATQAATEVKTFSQMMDSLKESAQSGWAQTWELIFGNFEEGKTLWTSIYNVVGNIIDGMSKARNALLGGALAKNFKSLSDRISGMLAPAKKAVDTVKTAANALEDLGAIVDRVIIGEFGNGKTRIEKLTKAGYKYATVQNAVNKKLGSSVRHLEDAAEGQEQLVDAQEDSVEVQKDLNKSDGERIEALTKLSDAELKALGYEKDQIEALRELQKEADKTGLSIKDFVDNIDDLNGRWLLLNSFKNIGQAISTVFKSMGEAWRNAFPAMQADQLYNIIAGFHKLTTYLVPTDETADKLTRTFKGLFAILDIITTIVGGPIKIAFKIFSQLLGMFDLNILDVTAAIGDVLVKFRDWMDSVLDFTKVFEKIKPALDKCIENISGWVGSMRDKFLTIGSNLVQGLANGLSGGAGVVWNAIVEFGKKILDTIKGILGIHSPSTETYEIGQNLISGLINGIKDGVTGLYNIIKDVCSSMLEKLDGISWYGIAAGLNAVIAFIPQLKGLLAPLAALFTFGHAAGKDTMSGMLSGLLEGAGSVLSAIADIAQRIIESFCNVLGIHSPSTVMIAIGKFLISGFVIGILGAKTGLFAAIKNVLVGVVDYIKNIEWPEIKWEHVLGITSIVGLAIATKKIYDLVKKIGDGIAGFGKMCTGAGNLMNALANKIDPKQGKMETIADAMFKFSISIAILAASVYVLAQLDTGKLWQGVAAIAALAGIVAVLAVVASKLGKSGVEFGKFALVLLSMSTAIWIMASALKKLEFLNASNTGFILGALTTMFVGLALVLGTIAKMDNGGSVAKASSSILGVGAAILLMAWAVKCLGGMNPAAMTLGVAAVGVFGVLVYALIQSTASTDQKKLTKIGATILAVGGAIALMGLTARILGGMELASLAKGVGAVAAFSVLAIVLMRSTANTNEKKLTKIGATILAVGGAIALMGLTARILGGMDFGALAQGVGAVAVFSLLIMALMRSTASTDQKKLTKIGATILAVGGAIALMGLTARILGGMDLASLAKGVVAVGIFAVIVTLMVKKISSYGGEATKCAGTILAMSVAIAIMAGVAILLSMMSWEGLAKGVGAVTVLGLILSLMMAQAQKAQGAMKDIIAISAAVGILAAAIYVLSKIDTKGLVSATAAIGVLMGMFSLMEAMAGKAKGATGALAVMTVAIAMIAGSIYLLAQLPVEQTIGSAIALSAMLLAMSGSLVILSSVGSMGTSALKGVLALTAMAVPLLAFVGILAIMQNVQVAAGNVVALIGLTTALTFMLIPLTIVGTFAAQALMGVLALTAMAVPLLAFVGTIALMALVPNAIANTMALTTLITAVGDTLFKISLVAPLAVVAVAAITALTRLIGIVGVFATAIGALFQKCPMLQEFLNTGLPVLIQIAGGIGQMMGAFVSGIATEIMELLPQLGVALSGFMTGALPFITGIKMVDENTLKGVGILTGAIIALTAAEFISGVTSFLGGGASFASLGAELSAFAISAMPFFSVISTVNPESLAGVKYLAQAILALTAADVLDGLTSWFTGGSSLTSFGEELAAFGPSFKTYADSVAGIDASAVESSANAAKALSEMAANLPNSGGVAGWFAGENSLAAFADELVVFGPKLKAYADSVAGIDETAIESSANAAKALAELATNLPNSGGMVSWFTGDNSLSSFASDLVDFGNAMKAYANSVTGIDPEVVTASANAAKALAELASNLPNSGGIASWFAGDNGLGTFGEDLVSFGNSMTAYSESIAGINTSQMSGVITQMNRLVSMANSMTDIDTSGMSGFAQALKTLASNGIKEFIKVFNDSSSKAASAVNKMIKAVVKDVKTKDNYNKFKSIGEYLVKGFAKGITENTYLAVAKARDMAKDAEAAAKAELQQNSPSKKFEKIGAGTVEGFVKGIDENVGDIEKASVAMGEAALKATQDELEINSPSLVFDKEVGRYVVQGIANGIKEETEAEKQAKEKANKIVTAFKEAFDKEINKYNTGKNIADNELELWRLWNPKATDEEIYNKEMAVYTEDLARQNHIAKLMHDEWRQSEDLFKKGFMTEQEVNEFYDKYVEQQITAKQAADKIVELQNGRYKTVMESIIEAAESDQDLRDAQYDFWTSSNKDATDEEKDRQYERYLRDWLAGLWTKQDAYIEAYNEAVRIYGKLSDEAKAAEKLCAENAAEINEIGDRIAQIPIDAKEREREKFENLQNIARDNNDTMYEIWEKTLGRDATDEEKEARKLASLTTKASYQTQLLNSAYMAWIDAKNKFGEGSVEEQQAYQEYLDRELALVTTQSDILDIEESIADRQKRVADKQKLARSEYDDYIKKYKKYYEENGMSLEDLERDAKLVSGYDPTKAVSTIVNGTKNAVAKVSSSPAYNSTISGFNSMGASYVNAVNEGVTAQSSALTTSITTMVAGCASAITDQSETWIKAGSSIMQSFITGIARQRYNAISAVVKIADAALDAIQRSFNANPPTITPVLDMSTVNRQLASLNVGTSTYQAAGISASMSGNEKSLTDQNGNKLTGSNIYNYVQNNYSPKALSASTIYRNTKSLIATTKGA